MADYTRFQLRGDTKANWLSVNPILAKNEPAIETDTNRFKIGDGVSTYSQLSYGRNTVEYSSLYNVTSLFPLPSGYYSHESAVLAIPGGERSIGLIITYATSANVWCTERFIGTNVSGWTTVSNWERLPNASDVSRLDSNISNTNSHIANKSNPHQVTKSQVGLGNVDNTSDIDKPISTLQQAAITATTNAFNGHVANTSNPHSVTKSQVGLSNVDNTSDSNKPISSATQTALNGKVNNSGNESIAGVKTFEASPIVPTPTSDNEAVNKVYVDEADAQLRSDLNDQVNKLPTQYLSNSFSNTGINIPLEGSIEIVFHLDELKVGTHIINSNNRNPFLVLHHINPRKLYAKIGSTYFYDLITDLDVNSQINIKMVWSASNMTIFANGKEVVNQVYEGTTGGTLAFSNSNDLYAFKGVIYKCIMKNSNGEILYNGSGFSTGTNVELYSKLKPLTSEIVGWAISESYSASNIIFDSKGIISSADIEWADGNKGSISNVTTNNDGITSIRYNRSNGDYVLMSITYNVNGTIKSQKIEYITI